MADTVNEPSCSYNTLKTYNSASSMSSMDSLRPKPVAGKYIVPNYSAIGYSALTHSTPVPSCSGYFNYKWAYGNDADCDQQYSVRTCM